ncbi:hypothetical protein [Pseudomonas sp. 25 E 4]|nr:hypothetical protein [Pseudomonas sp. 25 E 4]
MSGHHVVGQAAEQPGVEIGRRFALRYQPGHQLFAALYQHYGFTHLRVLQEAGFDFAQLDAQTAQLDLMVEAAEVVDHAIGTLAHAVAGAVQALACGERAGHKTLGGQPRAPVVTARQTDAAQVQLTGHAGRHRVELGIEHVGGEVGNRATDGHAVGALVDAGPVGHVDGGFGGAVQVVQGCRRQPGEHLLLRVQRQGFAAAHDTFEAGAGLHAWLMDKRLQHRRYEMQGGNGVPANGLDQPRGLAVFPGSSDHQACARHQWPEEFPHRYVEAERGFLQDRVTGVQAIGLLHPAQAVDQRAMAVARALGLAGGTGGVDHIGKVQRIGVDLGSLRTAGVETAQRSVQHDDLQAVRWQQRQQGILSEQQRDAAVFDHVGQALARILRVQRHVRATGLEDRQQAHHHLDGALDADTHQHIRTNTALAQGVGQLVGAAVEFGIGQGGGAEHQRGRVRRALHLFGDQLMQRAFAGVSFGGLVPGLHQQVLLVLIEHRQFADTLLAVTDHGLQQADPVPRHALDGRRVEQIIGVGQRGMQGAGLFPGVQAQVELSGAALPFHLGQRQARSGTHRCNIGHHRLMVVHHLEQRRVAEAALHLERFHQALERQLLMRLGAERMLLDALQQLADACLSGQFGAQHLGVDEEADQPFDLIAVTVGNRHADANVALAGVAMQQHVERTEQQHEQGHVVCLCAAAQLGGQRGVNRESVACALVARHRRARAIGGQFQHRVLIAQTRLPVIELAGLLPGFQPAALPQGVVAVLDRQRRQLRRLVAFMGVVETDELVDQHVHRPAIGDDVVQGQQQDVLPGVEPEQLHAQQRAGFQIEGQQRLSGGRRGDRLFARSGRQAAEVRLFNHQRRFDGDLQQALVGLTLEHRAQGFVARDQTGEGLLHRGHTQRALEPHRTGQVVGAAGRVQPPQKPHALLRVG